MTVNRYVNVLHSGSYSDISCQGDHTSSSPNTTIKFAQIAQRAIAIGTKAASSTDLLTEEEKQQLLSNIKLEIDDLQQETTEVEDELERLKVV